jgi:hypothetical protein
MIHGEEIEQNYPSKAEDRLKILKDSVRTSKRTPHFTITKINWLKLFKEIIAVYIKNFTKPLIQYAQLQGVKWLGHIITIRL